MLWSAHLLRMLPEAESLSNAVQILEIKAVYTALAGALQCAGPSIHGQERSNWWM